jgi:hypothetical protein
MRDKKAELEEQYRIQQEMLSRRKNKGKMNAYFEQVDKRREDTQKEMKKTTVWQKSKKDDVLEEWKEAKKDGKINPLGYEAAPGEKPRLILPGNPIGMPKMDNGERFDLRLPYAERGYVDESADVMGKMGKVFGSMFGGKKSKGAEETDTRRSSKEEKPEEEKSKKKGWF